MVHRWGRRDYQWAQDMLASAKDRSAGKPLENNTRLYARGDDFAVQSHSTDVVTIHPDDSVTLDSGGWKTTTTKDRINGYASGVGIRVYSSRGVWHVYSGGQVVCVYADGMRVYADGRIEGAGAEDTATTVKELRRRVDKYVRGYVAALYAGEIGAPDAGDCFYCGMHTVGGDKGSRPLGDAMGDISHLISHMDEAYYVPSLVWNALRALGGSPAARQSVMELQRGGTTAWGGIVRDQVTRILRRYMLRQLGVGA